VRSWVALGMLGIACFGACFTYDSIGGLSVGLTNEYGFSTTQLGVLYSGL